MNTFSIKEAISFGWNIFTKRSWFFIGIFVCVFIAYSILSSITDPERHAVGMIPVTTSLAAMLLGLVLEMMLLNLVLKSHDNVDAVQVSDMWSKLPFWKYIGVKLLNAIIVIVGFILLIVPGVIAVVTLMFGNYLVVDKGLGPIEAIKESARITKGHRWNLLGFLCVIMGINILGFFALFVGLLVSVPVSLFAIVHVYRTLAHKAGELAPISR